MYHNIKNHYYIHKIADIFQEGSEIGQGLQNIMTYNSNFEQITCLDNSFRRYIMDK